MPVIRFLLFLQVAFPFTVAAQENTNRRFILNAEKIARQFLASFIGEQTMEHFIILNEQTSMIRNDNTHQYFMLTDYRNDYKPTWLWLNYDFRYQGETVFTVKVEIDDSLKIRNADKPYDFDAAELAGWKNVLENKFTFNYDRLKAFIKSNVAIDTSEKYISIRYKSWLHYFKKDGKFFVETKYFWKIKTYYTTPDTGGRYLIAHNNDDIFIDVNTGLRLSLKNLENPYGWMNKYQDIQY